MCSFVYIIYVIYILLYSPNILRKTAGLWLTHFPLQANCLLIFLFPGHPIFYLLFVTPYHIWHAYCFGAGARTPGQCLCPWLAQRSAQRRLAVSAAFRSCLQAPLLSGILTRPGTGRPPRELTSELPRPAFQTVLGVIPQGGVSVVCGKRELGWGQRHLGGTGNSGKFEDQPWTKGLHQDAVGAPGDSDLTFLWDDRFAWWGAVLSNVQGRDRVWLLRNWLCIMSVGLPSLLQAVLSGLILLLNLFQH